MNQKINKLHIGLRFNLLEEIEKTLTLNFFCLFK